jgi:4-hydroxybenzoate polyprenyltransferase
MNAMTLRTALKLGRVSNLPTVWSNVLAGAALAGGAPTAGVVVSVGVAASLLYVAGTFLNDAFDHAWDAEHRGLRPIPRGEVSARTVYAAGFAMMAAGLVVLGLGPGGARALVMGLVLAGLIVLYDASHKKKPLAPLAPLVLGLCRVAVYFLAARAATPTPAPPLYFGSLFLLCYLVLLTVIAREESKNPKLPVLVSRLIAGICLVDGAQLLVLDHPALAALCAGGFVLTLRLQRRVAGT